MQTHRKVLPHLAAATQQHALRAARVSEGAALGAAGAVEERAQHAQHRATLSIWVRDQVEFARVRRAESDADTATSLGCSQRTSHPKTSTYTLHTDTITYCITPLNS